jgi:hypothetical protein
MKGCLGNMLKEIFLPKVMTMWIPIFVGSLAAVGSFIKPVKKYLQS